MVRGGHAAARREIAKLQDFLGRIGKLPEVLASEAAPEITRLLQKQFDEGTDPYGRSWRSLMPSTMARGRQNPPLTDTRKLRNGTKAYALPGKEGLRLTVGASYATFHQTGFHSGRTYVAPRRIFPREGLPRSWVKILNDAAKAIVNRAKSKAGL